MSMNLSVGHFDLLWLVLMNQVETIWLASQLPLLFCYCTDYSQLNQAVSSSRSGVLLYALWYGTLLQSFDIFYAPEGSI